MYSLVVYSVSEEAYEVGANRAGHARIEESTLVFIPKCALA